MPADRLAGLDLIKATGAIAVVLIHALGHPSLQDQTAVEAWLLSVTRFAVPGFLAVSGFLYASSRPIPLATTWKRLRRVLLPYLVASVLGQLYWAARGMSHPPLQIARELLLGATFGPYYYVFAVATLILIAPVLARVPRRWLGAFLVLLCLFYATRLVAAATTTAEPDLGALFWFLRDPANGGTYFLCGWLAGLRRDALQAFCSRWRGRLWGPWTLLCAALSIGSLATTWPIASTLCGWLLIFALVGLIFLTSSPLPRTPRSLRFASETSYAVYLYHLFFTLSVLEILPRAPGAVPRAGTELAAFAAGLLGSVALAMAARALLRERARPWIGA